MNSTGTALIYSTYLGGTNGHVYQQIGNNTISKVNYNSDAGAAIAVDASGQAYVTGTATSTNFPVTAGAFQTVNSGGTLSSFVTKLNSQGNALVYSTYLGGPNPGYATGIAIDASGEAYVTGRAYSTGFPVTSGAFQTVNNGAANSGFNAFVSKLNHQGSALLYSTYLGGSSSDSANGIAIDTAGNAYIVGDTVSEDFPVTSGAFQAVNKSSFAGNTGEGIANAFVAKMNSTGTALVYSTYLGGTYIDAGYAIAVDGSGNAYVTGRAGSTDFPVTPGAFQTVSGNKNNYPNAFVTKLNPSGTALDYSTYLGGNGVLGDKAYAIAVDASGNAYVTGSATSIPTTPSAFQTRPGAQFDNAFLTKLNPTGSALLYSTFLDGGDNKGSIGNGVAVDTDGNAYLTGFVASYDFPVTPGAFQTTNGGHGHGTPNGFVTKFNLAQPIALFSTTLHLFPDVAFNSSATPPVELITVTNTGGGTLTFTSKINSPDYTVLTDGQNTCTAGVTAMQSCTLPVEFHPTGVGIHTDTLTLSAHVGIGASISLRGTANGIGAATESPLNFGSIPYGTTKTLPLTIANFGIPGSTTIAVSFNNISYSLAPGGNCMTTGIAPGQRCNVLIKFSPVGHGVHNAGIILTPNPSSGAASSIVPVRGTATP